MFFQASRSPVVVATLVRVPVIGTGGQGAPLRECSFKAPRISGHDRFAAPPWRSAINLTGYLQPFTLPKGIRHQCVTMMKAMNLCMSCFDFIADEDGRYWFLELNKQSQFLWLEEQCASIPRRDPLETAR